MRSRLVLAIKKMINDHPDCVNNIKEYNFYLDYYMRRKKIPKGLTLKTLDYASISMSLPLLAEE